MKKPSHSLTDLSNVEQCWLLREYLIHKAKFLIPIEFPHSPGCFYYKAEFIDEQRHGDSAKNLCTVLLLLEKRDFIWPMKFHRGNPIHPLHGVIIPYWYFTTDGTMQQLSDKDLDSFDTIQYDEITQLANALLN